jgi:hypothetical protein
MKSYASLAFPASFVLALVISAPVANAQVNARVNAQVNAQVPVTQPYETVIVQPSGTLATRAPQYAVTAGQPSQVTTVETIQTIRPATRAVARHRAAPSRKIQDRLVTTDDRPLYNTVAAPINQLAVTTPFVQVQAAAVPVVAIEPGLSGQFQCIQGCAGGGAGPAFVTQNGWDLNIVNEIGQPSRAWIDYPGHIWVQNWNEGAVYSPDQMTIQFDNGTVWSKNVILVVPPRR